VEYRISEMRNKTIIFVSGNINRNAIYRVSTFLKPLLNRKPLAIVLDIDGLEDERDMTYHAGLVNAFRREIEQAGGILLIKTTRPSFLNYLRTTGMKRIFNIVDNSRLMHSEAR
jgi:anti-anti-sigma regulatory factor